MLDEAIPIADLADDFIKMVLYGQNRVGKTTLACCFPKPLLLVAMEPNKTGGAASVRRVEGVTYLKIDSSSKAVRLAGELKASNPFVTVVVDSATSYQDIILKELLNLGAVPEQLNWGLVSRDQYRERSEKTRECLRPFIDLDCHVIITAKERDHNPPDRDKPRIIRGTNANGAIGQLEVGSFFAADLGGATVGWLHDACDYIGRMYLDKEVAVRQVKAPGNKVIDQAVETGRIVRRLRTMYHPNYAAGFRSCTPEMVPEYIEAGTPEEMYEAIMAVIRGGRD